VTRVRYDAGMRNLCRLLLALGALTLVTAGCTDAEPEVTSIDVPESDVPESDDDDTPSEVDLIESTTPEVMIGFTCEPTSGPCPEVSVLVDSGDLVVSILYDVPEGFDPEVDSQYLTLNHRAGNGGVLSCGFQEPSTYPPSCQALTSAGAPIATIPIIDTKTTVSGEVDVTQIPGKERRRLRIPLTGETEAPGVVPAGTSYAFGSDAACDGDALLLQFDLRSTADAPDDLWDDDYGTVSYFSASVVLGQIADPSTDTGWRQTSRTDETAWWDHPTVEDALVASMFRACRSE
jgi:hypothetical protein